MTLEHAILDVRPGQAAAFEAAFAEARPIIAAAPGCQAVRLERCVERPGTYLLLVEWDSLEAHTEGFRGSAEYQRWRELLHHFYDPFPTVEHFETVVVSGAAPRCSLRPMTGDELVAFRDGLFEGYVAERAANGESEERARQVATQQQEQIWPGGEPGPGHRHYAVMADDRRVGSLWLGPPLGGDEPGTWVFFVVIEETERGHGYGRAAMLLAEEEARGRGDSSIGLNVFGTNLVARRLYESLGYIPSAINMRKEL